MRKGMRIFEDFNIMKGDQPSVQHLLQLRQHTSDTIGLIDNLDNEWGI
jgi:hypothetical protein